METCQQPLQTQPSLGGWRAISGALQYLPPKPGSYLKSWSVLLWEGMVVSIPSGDHVYGVWVWERSGLTDTAPSVSKQHRHSFQQEWSPSPATLTDLPNLVPVGNGDPEITATWQHPTWQHPASTHQYPNHQHLNPT